MAAATTNLSHRSDFVAYQNFSRVSAPIQFERIPQLIILAVKHTFLALASRVRGESLERRQVHWSTALAYYQILRISIRTLVSLQSEKEFTFALCSDFSLLTRLEKSPISQRSKLLTHAEAWWIHRLESGQPLNHDVYLQLLKFCENMGSRKLKIVCAFYAIQQDPKNTLAQLARLFPLKELPVLLNTYLSEKVGRDHRLISLPLSTMCRFFRGATNFNFTIPCKTAFANYWINKIYSGHEFQNRKDFEELFDVALFVDGSELLRACQMYVISHWFQDPTLSQVNPLAQPSHLATTILEIVDQIVTPQEPQQNQRTRTYPKTFLIDSAIFALQTGQEILREDLTQLATKHVPCWSLSDIAARSISAKLKRLDTLWRQFYNERDIKHPDLKFIKYVADAVPRAESTQKSLLPSIDADAVSLALNSSSALSKDQLSDKVLSHFLMHYTFAKHRSDTLLSIQSILKGTVLLPARSSLIRDQLPLIDVILIHIVDRKDMSLTKKLIDLILEHIICLMTEADFAAHNHEVFAICINAMTDFSMPAEIRRKLAWIKTQTTCPPLQEACDKAIEKTRPHPLGQVMIITSAGSAVVPLDSSNCVVS